jgi:hypothetical protein
MEFLRFLALVAAWGFMWRWVVKNRGSWNLFYGNIVGAAGGLVVGIVVLSITLSLFPGKHKPKATQPDATVAQEAAPDAPTAQLLPEAEPVVVQPSAPVSDNLPAYIASEPQNEPSPPESALLPNYSKRLTDSLSEKKVADTVGKNFAALRQAIGNDPNADKSPIANVMCTPFIHSAMRFPASAIITAQQKTNSKRFKDQTYTITNTVTARNMLGDDVTYRFDCSVQELPGKDSGYADWRLLDLKLQKVGS